MLQVSHAQKIILEIILNTRLEITAWSTETQFIHWPASSAFQQPRFKVTMV